MPSPVPNVRLLTNAAIGLGMLEAKRPDRAKEHLCWLLDGRYLASPELLMNYDFSAAAVESTGG